MKYINLRSTTAALAAGALAIAGCTVEDDDPDVVNGGTDVVETDDGTADDGDTDIDVDAEGDADGDADATDDLEMDGDDDA